MIIAVDVMGGDHGPSVVIPGADLLLSRRPEVRFALFGDEAAVRPVLALHPRLEAASTFTHCEVTVGMDEKPSQALRHGRWKSSMWKAVEAVKRGEAQVAVSAGNTGALMAMSKFCLRTLSNIERPAIAAIWPTLRSESIVLDVGATVDADAQQLIDFAVMGGAMARALFQIDRPTVGLLNIGVEEMKGNEEIRTAGQILRDSNLPNLAYSGFVEGDDIGQGKVDVIVTEGFAGNIALKTAEGTARQVGSYLKAAMSRTLMAKIGYFFARSAFERLREKMDPRKLNGGVFLGLNGIVIKSHGGTDSEGFASALDLGYDMVRNDLLAKINHDLSHYHRGRFGEATAALP
ncbi:phosphate acyltransferase PlsX [Chthonobacter albigriseus]|uniref:phosphate acyltransferase PlsX n=1 Tax=Chthonobacter albigriseus TaxID=1683161 RepID=UPI0015EE8EBB|nr:phosphate acyltransferase PlsX [Chthonobacter albigriseus]